MTVCDDARGSVKLEFYRGCAFLHLTLLLPMEGMRAVKAQFVQVKAWLKSMGHACVFVNIPEADEKLYRFERHMGFEPVRRVNGHIIMRQGI